MAETTGRAEGEPTVPPIVYAEASVRSSGDVSLFSNEVPITEETVPGFYSDPGLVGEAVDQLGEAGFEVLQTARTTVTIAGPPGLYEDAFRTSIVAEERTTVKYYGREGTATFLECPETEVPGLIDPAESCLSATIEGVALNEPVYPLAFANPPVKAYWHLDVPAGVSLGINADRVHRSGITGSGVRVVMVDTGWHRHPFFVERGYRAGAVKLGPGAQDPDVDEDGHGTGESANVFAVAPDVEFAMVKMGPSTPPGPSRRRWRWGRTSCRVAGEGAGRSRPSRRRISPRRRRGQLGEAGHHHRLRRRERALGFPGAAPRCHLGRRRLCAGPWRPATTPAGSPARSTPAGTCPTCAAWSARCRRPATSCSPSSRAERRTTPGREDQQPDLDETAPGDGWAVFSGTSAAAPQLAGVCALMKQAYPGLSPTQARDALKQTARDVVLGRCSASTGANQASTGPDLATGHGLADAHQAVTAVSGP